MNRRELRREMTDIRSIVLHCDFCFCVLLSSDHLFKHYLCLTWFRHFVVWVLIVSALKCHCHNIERLFYFKRHMNVLAWCLCYMIKFKWNSDKSIKYVVITMYCMLFLEVLTYLYEWDGVDIHLKHKAIILHFFISMN